MIELASAALLRISPQVYGWAVDTTSTTANDALAGSLIQYTSYGVLGLTVVGFLTGKLVPGWLYKRSEDENKRLRDLIDNKVYPLIESNTRVTEKAVEVMRDINASARR